MAPSNETRNIFYWITWKVNLVWCWNLANLCHITKEKCLSKIPQKTSSRPFYVYKESSTTSIKNGIFETNWLYWISNSKSI